jgi:hypothetical protein
MYSYMKKLKESSQDQTLDKAIKREQKYSMSGAKQEAGTKPVPKRKNPSVIGRLKSTWNMVKGEGYHE